MPQTAFVRRAKPSSSSRFVAGQFCGRPIRDFVVSCANMVATLLRKNFKCLSWVMSPSLPSPFPHPNLPGLRGRVGRQISPLRSNRRNDPRKSLHESTERRAARFEILELIVRRTRGRQQHDRMIVRRSRSIACSFLDGAVEGAGRNMVDLAVERFGELLRGGANQVGLADAGKIAGELIDAARLGLAARDPKDVAEA